MKTFIITLATIALFSQPALAARGQGPGRGMNRGEMMARQLNLTEQQKKSVQEIRLKYQPQLKEKGQKLRTARDELHNAVKAPQKGKAYQDTLLGKFKTVQDLRNGLAEQRFRMALEIREILDPDQIAKFRGMQGPKGPRGKNGGRGAGPGTGPGPMMDDDVEADSE